jgi:hypothetical protein
MRPGESARLSPGASGWSRKQSEQRLPHRKATTTILRSCRRISSPQLSVLTNMASLQRPSLGR